MAMSAEQHGKAGVFGMELDLDLAVADFAGEWLVATEATLRRIGEGQEETFVAARQILQPQIARRPET